MPDNQSDYKVGPGRPPLHTRFKKGRSGNPGGRNAKTPPALLADALDETVCVTINGRRRKLTKREAIIAQMVDKSASANLRATKMLIEIMKEVEYRPSSPHHRPNRARSPRRTRRWCNCSWRGCVRRYCGKWRKERRQRRLNSLLADPGRGSPARSLAPRTEHQALGVASLLAPARGNTAISSGL
jgi:hypothetical protein